MHRYIFERDPVSNEAAIKYFMFGALSSAILVFAIGLVYGITGTTNIGAAIHAMASLQADSYSHRSSRHCYVSCRFRI